MVRYIYMITTEFDGEVHLFGILVVSGAHGYPDTQLVSYGEMLAAAGEVSEGLTGAALELSKSPIPCIADGGT